MGQASSLPFAANSQAGSLRHGDRKLICRSPEALGHWTFRPSKMFKAVGRGFCRAESAVNCGSARVSPLEKRFCSHLYSGAVSSIAWINSWTISFVTGCNVTFRCAAID